MLARNRTGNIVEYSIVAFLLLVVSLNALGAAIGSVMAALHFCTLLSGYVMARTAFDRLSLLLGSLFFALTFLILIGEWITQSLAGLHINWFLITTLRQDGALGFIGLNSAVFVGIIFIVVFACTALAHAISKIQRPIPRIFMPLKLRYLVLGFFATLMAGQLFYALAYYYGASAILPVQRQLPFFVRLHPHITQPLLARVLGPRGDNPFAEPEIDLQTSRLHDEDALTLSANAPNIILVVADSIRAADIKENPDLAPTLFARAKNGFFSLDHLSVSNCTHFSFYSMMSGKLPTGFGETRRAHKQIGFIPALSRAGYAITSAESVSLNWYDLSDIIFPPSTVRTIFEGDDPAENDRAVTDATIGTIKSWQKTPSGTQGFHLAYYHGSHFPYGDSLSIFGDTSYQRYLASIALFDGEMARLFEAIDEADAWDNTVVIVTSDHGENFLENGFVGHTGEISDTLVRVPFAVFSANGALLAAAQHIESHKEMRAFIQAIVQGKLEDLKPQKNQFIARCDYDQPNEFKVMQKGQPTVTLLDDDGYLVPVEADLPEDIKRNAATQLLQQIQKDAP